MTTLLRSNTQHFRVRLSLYSKGSGTKLPIEAESKTNNGQGHFGKLQKSFTTLLQLASSL